MPPKFLTRRERSLLRMLAEPDDRTMFVLFLPVADQLKEWYRHAEVERVVEDAAKKALERFARRSIPPGRVLASLKVSAEARSQAARSMLAKRGGRAVAAKMRALGFPNLVRARDALRRKTEP